MGECCVHCKYKTWSCTFLGAVLQAYIAQCVAHAHIYIHMLAAYEKLDSSLRVTVAMNCKCLSFFKLGMPASFCPTFDI